MYNHFSNTVKKYTYDDGYSIEYYNNTIRIKLKNNKEFQFTETDKPKFDNGKGESVIELSGLVTDNNPHCSWAKASYKPGGQSTLHYHTERTEDYYIISGEGIVIIDGNKYNVSSGDYIHILPNQRHQVIANEKNPLVLLVKCEPSWIYEDQHNIESDEAVELGEKNISSLGC